MSSDLNGGGREAADFRMLVIMRAAMKPLPSRCAPIFPLMPEKNRRGLRRVLRVFARPFEQLGKAFRRKVGAAFLRTSSLRRLRWFQGRGADVRESSRAAKS